MAEILPSDIGLATFADVGDVANLRTNAKEVVAAINEVLANSQGTISGEQLYMEGEDNTVIGSGNIIFGNGNRVFGTGNLIIGDNHFVIGTNKEISEDLGDIYIDRIDVALKRIYFFSASGNMDLHIQTGDRVVISMNELWCDPGFSDWISIDTEKCLTTVTEVNLGDMYICVAEMPVSTEPPDSIHTILDYISISSFYILRDEYKKLGNGSVTMGQSCGGLNSFSTNTGNAEGSLSAAVNDANAVGENSFACNLGIANDNHSFAANFGKAYQAYAAALNYGNAYGYYSAAFNAARTAGRAIKCVAISVANKTLTAASGENLVGLTGSKILIRYKNNGYPIIYIVAKVTGVSGQTIYLSSDTDLGWPGFGEDLISDGYVFRIESSNGYNLASGYGMAGGSYAQAHGLYTIAAHAGAVTYGKYGTSPEEYSWSLANGTSLAAQGLAVKILQNGDIHADGTLTSPCADYSELFEWLDRNPNNEDRAGYFVKLAGDKITIADEFDAPLGVISAMPAIIGDSGEMHWHGKYLTDDFGRVKYHDVVIPEEKDEEGNIIAQERIERHPMLNPEWDSTQEYVPRLKRPEWATVGVLGKLIVYDDGTLQRGDMCRCGAGGKAVKSIKGGYPVLKRVSDDKVLIWFRG